MNLLRIQQEFADAQRSFAYVELHPTVDGKVFAKTALQTPSSMYVLSIRFPDTYPNEMPRVYVDAPAITSAPHRYQQGNICYMHPTLWNPGRHNLEFVIARAAKWLNKYEVWRVKGEWPGAGLQH
ncbi:ubiquitin-protein ligase [Bradyrhizobium sp. GM0.4]